MTKEYLIDQINQKMEHLNEADTEGFVWWNRFKSLIEEMPIPVVIQQSEILPKRLSARAYHKAKLLNYEGFVKWWDKQV